jgi:DNA polymerase I-like protein with 3'-5' exonuclease and polymerase domains
MNRRIAVIEKCPSSNRYKDYFEFDFELFRLSSVKLAKVLKKDVDIEFNPDDYDYVILVGSEAAKYYAKITSVTDFAGHLVNDKFIPLVNPAMIVFKPENKPQFLASVERLHKVLEGKSLVNTSGTWLGIQDKEEALRYLDLVDAFASETGVLALDTETTALYPHDGYVLGISICAREQNAAYIDTDCVDDEVAAKFQYLFNKYKVVFHNAKFDVKMLQYHFNFKFPDLEDTLVLHYVLDETQGSHGLKSLALKYTEFGAYDSELDDFKKAYCREHGLLESEFSYERIPFSIMYEYAAKDTGACLELYNKFKPLVTANSKLDHVYNRLLMPSLRALVDIELAGVPFDKRRLQFAQATIDKAIADATKHLYSLPEVREFEKEQGKEFNPNSVLQLRKLLFDKLGLIPLAKKTGTGLQSTDAEVLESLDGQHEVVNSIISIRKLGKIKNTYVDNLLANLNRDLRVRTGFNLTSTTSGRLSSSGKFNAQQLPRDEKRVKGAIKGTGAYEGWKIVSQDLQTGEVYIAAVLSGDKKLQQIFIDKKD